jgi:hypothetical protein
MCAHGGAEKVKALTQRAQRKEEKTKEKLEKFKSIG